MVLEGRLVSHLIFEMLVFYSSLQSAAVDSESFSLAIFLVLPG